MSSDRHGTHGKSTSRLRCHSLEPVRRAKQDRTFTADLQQQKGPVLKGLVSFGKRRFLP